MRGHIVGAASLDSQFQQKSTIQSQGVPQGVTHDFLILFILEIQLGTGLPTLQALPRHPPI